MPTQYDMNEDSELYRGILAYEVQPMRDEPNPHYDPSNVNNGAHRLLMPWRKYIPVPDGPKETREMMIGPYQSIGPIKSYITRNRSRHDNLRLVRVERASAWEEVQI